MSSTNANHPAPAPPSGQTQTFAPAQRSRADYLPSEEEASPSVSPSGLSLHFESQPEFQYNASLHPLDTVAPQANATIATPHGHMPLSTRLRLQTEHLMEKNRQDVPSSPSKVQCSETPSQQTVFNAGLPVRHSSIRSVHSSRTHGGDSISPGSVVSSPGVGPLVDMTPLPSPIGNWGSPKPWTALVDSEMEGTAHLPDPIQIAPHSPKKPRIPLVVNGSNGQAAQIYNANIAAHSRNRSLSEYVPEGMQMPKPRNIVVSTSGAPIVGNALSPPDEHMHREEYLAVQRGLAIAKPPTPPDSNRGTDTADLESPSTSPLPSKLSSSVLYEARTIRGGRIRKWRAIRQLGKGTFSTVMLATSEEKYGVSQNNGSRDAEILDSKKLVAVKICEQGPAGGADEKKVEVSIIRELEIMKSINHPSIVQLKAISVLDRQALLVLNYCPGGDLFDLASSKLGLLTLPFIQRIFAELVAAVRYLHLQYIVHRDIKLENVLVNISTHAINKITDWQTYRSPVITLTDLGLGRWIPKPPDSPLLDTRCGSEDYAAPELLMGNLYDGRSIDAWALGVLLYSLMEGRLPFDPIPGSRRRSPVSHRIARCEWQWIKYADAEGEWDATKGKDFEGAREIVEGLVARARDRWSLEKVQGTAFVGGAITVAGGLRRDDDDDDAN